MALTGLLVTVLLTILKIIGYILLAVLVLVLIVLLLPLRAEVSFIGKKLAYRVRVWFIPIISSGGGGIVGWLKRRSQKKDDDDDADNADYLTDEDIEQFLSDIEHDEEDSSHVTDVTDSVQAEEAAEEITEEVTEVSPSAQTVPASEDEPEDITPGSDTDKTPEKPKKSLGDKLEFILDLWRAADRPVLRLFKGIRLYDLYIDFIIANEDAYKCALNYGRICAAIYPLLGWMSTLFTVRLKTVDINAGFALDESRWDASVKVSFRIGTAVIAGIQFLLTYIFRYFIPAKLRERKRRKAETR